MVRRRSTKGKGRDGGSKPKPLKRSDGKLTKWNTVEDIPMDEEDQCKGGYDDDGDDDEVFALKGMEDGSDSDGDAHDYQEDEEDEEEDEMLQEEISAPKKKKSKKDKKTKGKAVEEDEAEPEEEEEESWGRGRAAYYSSNADQLESDDEEGNELEEQEAKRLQTKMREEMNDEDFGLNDNPESEGNADSDSDILDPAPSVFPAPTTDKKSLLRHLEKTSPESLALARDWDDTAHSLQKTREKIAKLESEGSDALGLGMIHLHYRMLEFEALLSYSTMLAFYLHLRSSAKYAQRPALLQSHPILQRLLTLKQSLQTLEDLDFAASDSDSDDEDDFEDNSMGMDDILADGEQVWGVDYEEGLDSDELNDLLNDAKQPTESPKPQKQKPPKKKRKTQVQEEIKMVTPVFDLVEPEFVSSKPLSHRHHVGNDIVDAYGEAVALHSVDAADKTARKKSLRFHTSKIESASARRQGARNQMAGGDDDIPYRERKAEKEARLVKEAAIRAKNQVGAPLTDDDPEPQVGQKRSRTDDEDDEGAESPDEYYELVKKKSKEEKIKKKEEYEAASGRTRVDLENGEASGPRSLTRAILTNKGLTPHRPKAVRNPRVKKRQKYEKAKKKISSQKAVYKGGLSESGGRYDGERSGISKVVKSIPLG
ncbi:Sas10 C-terminal domain-containing protein [Flammula alnicola]|nr:Sas10 C-terminal domain-containing protein [Flammula alnicola]